MAASRLHTQRPDRIIPATLLALGVHLVVIFGLGFSLDFPRSIKTASAVTFALTPAPSTPDDARHTAAQDQQGEQAADPVAERFPTATLSIASSEPSLDAVPSPGVEAAAPSSASAASPENFSDPVDSRNPRAGAVAARRALDAEYLLSWRRRVEQVGNALYRQATARHGSGDVRLLVVVSADGTLDRVAVITSSGKPALDDAAVDTVRRAAPFPPFPADLRAQTPRLEIIRTWQFRHQSGSG